MPHHRPPSSSRRDRSTDDPRRRALLDEPSRRRRTHQRLDSSGEPYISSGRTRRASSARPARRHEEKRRSEYYADDASETEIEVLDAGQGSPSKSRPKRHHDRERERDGEALRRQEQRRRERDQERSSLPRRSARGFSESRSRGGTGSGSTGLSSAALAQLDRMNDGCEWDGSVYEEPAARCTSGRFGDREREARGERGLLEEQRERDKEREDRRREHRERRRKERLEEEKAAALAAAGAMDEYETPTQAARSRRKEQRVTSGQALERGYSEKDTLRKDLRIRGGGFDTEPGELPWWKKKKNRKWIALAIGILLLVIIIPVAVVTSQKGNSSSAGDGSSSSKPANGNLQGISPSSIPKWAQGGYLDPFDWYTTLDFNVTFTDQTVGGLYVMGLNSTWNDDTQANPNVPKLNEKWEYGTMQIRGMNLGGWLSIEPFISPSLFDGFDTSQGVVDEYTLSQTLGATTAKSTIEQHYATWVTEQTFADIVSAGFDHVRIPYSYWAVKTYEGDPYVPMVSWRYLLRGIEWARKYGLRVNLDLHGLPGSQNGMNHSGRQGLIGWLNGTDGTLNGNRSIAIHDQLSTFFAQPRYQNIIALYGLANEPRMTFLDPTTVLEWSQQAITTIRNNNFTNLIVVGDGFWALNSWKGQLQDPNVVLDAHQYVIFNTGQIVFNHSAKVNYACAGWTSQAKESMNTNTGFGPTIFGEWSQADTDCATYLNNVGVGSRWEGTLNLLDAPGTPEVGASIDSVLSPTCPTNNNPRCDCTPANADPSTYSAVYKQWLLDFAEAQMYSFEFGWGWFYWTWQTETAVQWSYQSALAAGIVPQNARVRSWDCTMAIPDYEGMGLPEYY